MNFIVYGNEDSPVVPILLYEPGKVTYVREKEMKLFLKLSISFSLLQVIFSRAVEEEDSGGGGGVSCHLHSGGQGQDLSLCLPHSRNARLCMLNHWVIVAIIISLL